MDAPGILVVDDEQMLLSLLETVFRRRGFRVWAAGSGEAALRLYERHQAEINVALLDVTMPGLDGPATLAGLRRVNPGVLACFMSGYTARHTAEELCALGASRFFEKPFQIAPLADEMWRLAQQGRRQTA